MRILLVEDEEKMAALVRRGFAEEGFATDVVGTAEDAVWMGSDTAYDVIVLDIMLPDGDGFEVCRRLRAANQWAPVIMLTARDHVEDRVAALDGGADDYLTKPFSFEELLARMRALVRRGALQRPAVLRAGPVALDPAAKTVPVDGTPVELTAREFAILEFLMRHPGEVMNRTQIRENVWDFSFESDSNIVDVYVRYLREKIDRPLGVTVVETVRGAGYRLRGDDAASAHKS